MPNLNFDSKFYTVDNQQHSELQGVAVTPNDSADLPNGTTAAIYVTGAGNINLDLESVNLATGALAIVNATITVTANTKLTLRAARVRATSTTATGIFALYRASNL